MDILNLVPGMLNASGTPVHAEPIGGQVVNPLVADAQTTTGFSDALLNVVNTLMVGPGKRTAGVSVTAEAIHQKAGENADDTTQDDASLLNVNAQQQLLDALLMPRPMPVSAENLLTAAVPTEMPLPQRMQTRVSGPALMLGNAAPAAQPVTTAETALAVKSDLPPTQAVSGQPQVAPQLMAAMTAMTAVTPDVMTQPVGATAVTPAQTTVSNDTRTAQPTTLKLDTEDSRWGQQLQRALGERLQVQVKNQIQHATIRLDPPEMGKIDISLQLDNGRVQVQINASHAEVYRALQQTSNDLRQSLTEQNFVQVNVQVSSQSGGQQQGKGAPFAEQQNAILSATEIAAGNAAGDTARREDDSVLLTV